MSRNVRRQGSTGRRAAVEGGLAHELKNLLSLINGYADLLALRVAADAGAQRQVGEIRDAGRQAAELVRALLTRGERPPAPPGRVDLNALVRGQAEVLTGLVGRAGRVELRLAPRLPAVLGDPSGLRQALVNLVLNARDALGARGRIVIRTDIRLVRGRRTAGARSRRLIRLTVEDNGAGMDAATLRRLFEPFFSTKPAGLGTGLGLAQVYGVVRRSGGHIAVRSGLRQGSRFEVLLPAFVDLS